MGGYHFLKTQQTNENENITSKEKKLSKIEKVIYTILLLICGLLIFPLPLAIIYLMWTEE